LVRLDGQHHSEGKRQPIHCHADCYSAGGVTTVASAGDAVLLPPAIAGLDMIVVNHGANPMQVYANGSGAINDVTRSTGVSQMQGSVVIFSC
jgi:hypothetical protein